MKFLSALVLLLAFNPVWACSCMSIGSIEESIDHLPILVEAQVISLEQVDTVYGRQTHSATLKVKRVLKGNVSSDAVTVEHWMCYASLDPDMMKVGHTYVLPLHTPTTTIGSEWHSARTQEWNSSMASSIHSREPGAEDAN
jgi:hypothetical protein